MRRDTREFLPDALALERRPLPFPARATLHALCACVVCFLAWAAWARVDRIVTADGRLVTTEPLTVVQPLETSIIRTLNVAIGDVVTAGTVLATLDPTFTDADAASLRTRLESLEAQIRRLDAVTGDHPMASAEGPDQEIQRSILERQVLEYQSRLESFRQRSARVDASLATARVGQRDLAERLSVFSEIEGMRRDLNERQTGSRLQLLEATSQVLALRGQLNDMRNKEAELLHERSVIEADSMAFAGEWRRKLSEELIQARRDRDDVAERLVKAERRGSLVSLTSPVDAVVLEMAKLSVGSIVKDAEPLVKLVPLNVPLELEVDIAAGDIGLVEPGAPVRIKLEAFPFQRHGTLDGEVRTIGADAVLDPAERSSGAHHRTRVRLLTTRPRDVPESQRIGPGFVARAEIKVGTRSVLSFLLYPIIRTLDESVREP
ncbi:hemolysin secretion protein D [Skermanella stibiiresistens SB22]|uniref:Membrane fusion protein (MFP) family protein n=1 Tax=Skermanella stibiiresistens SB22 TaxID=1385369 RepID=W9HEG1_9PROT|nr:HlyD family type I secretion periplasmic adaptor subunit [Skermanella stibiiresistens]EWY42283.1 hemolysin secretion protein D [Skermanella stibiiresistens SB22]